MHKIIPFLAIASIASISLPARASVDIPVDFADRGIRFPLSAKGATINIKTAKINGIVLSDRSCVVYTQLQNSIYLKTLSPCLRLSGSPDRNPVLRVFTSDSAILKFNICSQCSGSKDLNIIQSKPSEPIAIASKPIKSSKQVLKILPPAPPVEDSPVATPSIPAVSVLPLPSPRSTPFQLLAPLKTINNVDSKRVDEAPKSVKRRNRIKAVKNPVISPIPARQAISIAPSQPTFSSSSPIVEVKTTPSSTRRLKSSAFKLSANQAQAKALLEGLNRSRLAKGSDRIAFQSRRWMLVQDTIYFLKKGNTLPDAIKKSRAPEALIKKLLRLGGISA
jgi:hypothetical protein